MRTKLLDQLELQLFELETGLAQGRTAEEINAAQTRRKPTRRPLPAHLPRECLGYEASGQCSGCGDTRLRKLGDDVSETLEYVPARWTVIQRVREKFGCRDCETISQAPARTIRSRGRAGVNLLAHILLNKCRAHLPFNRERDIYANEGVDLDVLTSADLVGAATATLMPLVGCIAAQVLGGGRLYADDTTVPVLAKGKCRLARLSTYVRDDAPFARVAVGRRNRTFANSDIDGRRAAAIYMLIETFKLNDIDARPWLADVLARIAYHLAHWIDELLP